MIVLKIIGIILAVIIALIALFMISRIKLLISYTQEKGFRIGFGFWFLRFWKSNEEKEPKAEKKEKKPSKFAQSLKKRLGLDAFDTEELKKGFSEGSLSEKITQIAAIVMLFFERIKWLFSKIRADKFRILAVCGGDSADAAIEYGVACATVYPLSAYISDNLNFKKNAQDIQLKCNFDGDAYFEFDLTLSVRIYYILKTAIGCLKDLAIIAEKAEVLDNER